MEPQTSPEQFENMTPQDLNSRLRQCYDQIPSVGKNWKPLQQKVDNLLEYASGKIGTITNAFRMRLSVGFTFACINYEKGRDPFFRWALDLNDPHSGGLFDPNRAKELDEMGYRMALENVLSLKNAVENTPEVPGDHSKEDITNSLNSQQALQKLWREEFIEKHHDEP